MRGGRQDKAGVQWHATRLAGCDALATLGPDSYGSKYREALRSVTWRGVTHPAGAETMAVSIAKRCALSRGEASPTPRAPRTSAPA